VKKAADVLKKVLDEKWRQNSSGYSSVFGGWPQIIGTSLAEHSQIYEISNRNLFVEVDHPGWMQMLLLKRRQVLQILKRKFPELGIQDLKIKVQLQELEEAVAEVRSEELKRRLKRLFFSSIKRGSTLGDRGRESAG
jgi:predicted nucleic acid-binding Zn ribbon protein